MPSFFLPTRSQGHGVCTLRLSCCSSFPLAELGEGRRQTSENTFKTKVPESATGWRGQLFSDLEQHVTAEQHNVITSFHISGTM